MSQPDYFSAKDAVRRLEDAIGKAVIKPDPEADAPLRHAGEHIVNLGPQPAELSTEALADYVARRKAALTEQMDELEFLQAVEHLRRRFPRFFQ